MVLIPNHMVVLLLRRVLLTSVFTCFHSFVLCFSLIHLFVHYCACVTLQLHQESADSSSSDNESDEDGGPGDEDNDAVGLVEEAVAARAHSIQVVLKCDFCGEYSDKAL